jgi:hypothetical protein
MKFTRIYLLSISIESIYFREALNNPDIIKLVNSYRYKEVEDIFSNGTYNMDLYKYALEKIFDERHKEEELEEQKNSSNNNSNISSSWFSYLFSTKTSVFLILFMVLASIGLLAFHYKFFNLNAISGFSFKYI